MEDKVRALGSDGRLNEVQRGYVLQLTLAEEKGEAGTIAVLGASKTLADCLVSLVGEDASRPEATKRVPDWTAEEVATRVAKPAVVAGIEIVRSIEAAASQGQLYFKFQGGLDATLSTLSQTRRYIQELLASHRWPLAPGETDPGEIVESLYQRARPPLDEFYRKAKEERELRWAALGPGRRP
ncbi:MAG: hypothetical protein L3J93_04880 [Thermoplasmata archaeon]|nr:hypothetical protein [Thermoplasmata archaeon]